MSCIRDRAVNYASTSRLQSEAIPALAALLDSQETRDTLPWDHIFDMLAQAKPLSVLSTEQVSVFPSFSVLCLVFFFFQEAYHNTYNNNIQSKHALS